MDGLFANGFLGLKVTEHVFFNLKPISDSVESILLLISIGISLLLLLLLVFKRRISCKLVILRITINIEVNYREDKNVLKGQ